MRNYFAFIVFLLLAATASAQDCSLLKKGKFKHIDSPTDPTAYFIIEGNKHTEFMRDGKYFIESSLKWSSDCSYVLVLKKCTVPDFPFKKGTKMTVTVERVEGNKIFYSGIVNGEAFEGWVEKQE